MARRPIVLICGFFILGLGLLFLWGQRVEAQTELIILEHKGVFKEPQRPPVNFFHERHAEIYSDCKACHHNYEYKNGVRENTWNGEPQDCSQCHKAEKVGKTPALREAFHQNCTGCHGRLTKTGMVSGPATCGECHVRPEKLRAPHMAPVGGPTACADCHAPSAAPK
jgi:hypothetical protein